VNARTKHWEAMTLEEQHKAIGKLAAGCFGRYEISVATGLSIEQIEAVLGDAVPPDPNATVSD
jgi:hypothetical protein